MPDYEFGCEPCSVVQVKWFDAEAVPARAVLWCPRCKRSTEHRRLFSFGIPCGSSGEGLRDGAVRGV
jgi:hypothetical protein